jgi:predicted nucleic acid-binding Zn ribbon protein
MEPLKQILPDFYRRRSGADDVEQELALACWANAVGPDLARHTQPVRLARNMLVVDVATQALLDPLKSLSDRIMGRLNKSIGKPAVTRIVFRLALPGKIPVRRAATVAGDTVAGDTAAGDVAGDDAGAIQDPHLRRIYKQSRGNALRKPQK